jgi:diadenosine tetraphosphate (Ap4A) HIT family hydrolase
MFPNEGLTLWHSIGEAAFQEVPHLHLHIHPRFRDDGVLRVYPESPVTSTKEKRDEYAARLRNFLDASCNKAWPSLAANSDKKDEGGRIRDERRVRLAVVRSRYCVSLGI